MAELPKYFYYVLKVNGSTITVEDRSDRDVVEVVRCKDCEHWDKSWRPNDPTTHFCVRLGEFETADFYCGDGIRRQTDEAEKDGKE